MIKVIQTKEIKEGCANCLYRGCNGIICGNANNHGLPMVMINGGNACGWYWLDQNRFTRA